MLKTKHSFLLFALLTAVGFSTFAQTNETTDALKDQPNF
jgi:hypothetical protein